MGWIELLRVQQRVVGTAVPADVFELHLVDERVHRGVVEGTRFDVHARRLARGILGA